MAWSSGDSLSPTNLNNQSGERFHVAVYGAVGDGTTKDGAAFIAAQAAASAVSNGIIVTTPGTTYLIDSTLTLSGIGTELVGGGILKASAADIGTNGKVIAITGTRNRVAGIVIDQNNVNNGRSIVVSGATGAVIEDVYNINSQFAFVEIVGAATNTWVRNCYHNAKGHGVVVNDPNGAAGLFVLGNEISFGATTGLGDGVEINCPTNGFSHFIIANNYVHGQLGQASDNGIGIGMANAKYGVVANNRIRLTEHDGIHLEAASDHVVVSGNQVSSTGSSANDAGNGNGIAISGCRSVQVVNNNIWSVTSAYGIIVRANDGSTNDYSNIIEGNSIRAVDYAGIRLNGQRDFICRNNNIIACSQISAAGYGAIELVDIAGVTAVNREGTISGNVVRDSTTSSLGVWVDGDSVNISVIDNHLIASTGSQLALNSASGAYVAFNRMGSGKSFADTEMWTSNISVGSRVTAPTVVTTSTTAPLSIKTASNFNDMSADQLRLVFTASGMSLGISSGTTLYDIGSNTSASQPTS